MSLVCLVLFNVLYVFECQGILIGAFMITIGEFCL